MQPAKRPASPCICKKGNFLTFYTIILAITFYCDGKKEHLFRRISVTIEIPRKKLWKKAKQNNLFKNVLFFNVSCKESNLDFAVYLKTSMQ